MIDRRGMLLALAAVVGAPAAVAAPPRRRDLDGVWSSASYTDLQRPKALPRLVLTPAEAEAYEAPLRAFNGLPASPPGDVGQAENEFVDRGAGLARVKGQIRSSWIIDPPDGRIPWSATALARRYDVMPPVQGLGNPEERTGPERCLASVNAGAPMVGAPDSNLFQILETREAVVILSCAWATAVRWRPCRRRGWATRWAGGRAIRWWWRPAASIRASPAAASWSSRPTRPG